MEVPNEVVNQPIMKKDAMALVTGKPVFTNDKAPKRMSDREITSKSICERNDQIDQHPVCYESARD